MNPFQCPVCSGFFQVMPILGGQAVACPHCSAGILIPEMSPPADSSSFSAPESPLITEMAPEFQAIPIQPPLPQSPIAPPPNPTSGLEPPPLAASVIPLPKDPQRASSMPISSHPKYDPRQIPTPVAADPNLQRLFVVPTIGGGQTVVREPTGVVVSGSKPRQLRELSSEEKSTGRWIKNLVVSGLCAVLLMVLLSWLLK